MVDNESIALPHYGLTQADVVYEMMNSTENGRITRFMALVKDWETLEQFGSIRSARVTNCILAAEWNAVLCHDGGPFYIDDIYFSDIVFAGAALTSKSHFAVLSEPRSFGVLLLGKIEYVLFSKVLVEKHSVFQMLITGNSA